ncbi:MAG: hypothetical protein ACLR78_03180 [Roseburia sp.]
MFEGEESEFLTEAEEAAKRNMGADTVSCSFRSSCSHGVRGRKRGFYCLDASGMEKLILDGNGNIVRWSGFCHIKRWAAFREMRSRRNS